MSSKISQSASVVSSSGYLVEKYQQPQLLIVQKNNPLLQQNEQYTQSIIKQQSCIEKEIKQLKPYYSNIKSQSSYPTSNNRSNLSKSQDFKQSFNFNKKKVINEKKEKSNVKNKNISQIPQRNTKNLTISNLSYSNQNKKQTFSPTYNQSKVGFKLPQSQIDNLSHSLQKNNADKSQILKNSTNNKSQKSLIQKPAKIKQQQKVNQSLIKEQNKSKSKSKLKNDQIDNDKIKNSTKLSNSNQKRNSSIKANLQKQKIQEKKQKPSNKIDQKCYQCQIM